MRTLALVLLILMVSSVAMAEEPGAARHPGMLEPGMGLELERGLDAVHGYYESERMLWGGTNLAVGGSVALLSGAAWYAESQRSCTWLCFEEVFAVFTVTGAAVAVAGAWKLAVPGAQERTLATIRQGRGRPGYEARAMYALQRIATEERGWRLARAGGYGLGAGALLVSTLSGAGGSPSPGTGMIMAVGMGTLALWNFGVASEPELVYEALKSGREQGMSLSLSPAMIRAPKSGHMHTGLSLSGRW